MRISTEWLREYLDVPAVEELAAVFELAGIGVEEVEGEVFTLEVTSNRGDWLCASGLAREIGAMTDRRVRLPRAEAADGGETPEHRITVEIEDPNDCPRYVAMLIEGVKVGPSPDWIQQRIIACGMRPINNIVDITNYVMLETGQPLHAFDADKLRDNHIIVRHAKAGETLTTLDGVERTLSEEALVIADPSGAIAVAGVMGGGESEVTESTTRILLESAHFAPARVRRGSRTISMKTEASRRFERWVDPNECARVAKRTAALFTEFAGATPNEAMVDRYLQPVRDAEVTLRIARCGAVLGLPLSETVIVAALQRLGFKVGSQIAGVLQVSVPTWRRDIEREVDLIEEVARIHGYGNIPTTLPKGANLSAGRSLAQRLEDRAKSALLRCGLNEIVTYSLQNEAAVERAGVYEGQSSQPTVQLRNPLSEDYTQLRTSLIPSLLEVLEKNGSRQARVFEIGRVYHPIQGAKQPHERRRIGIALLDAPAPLHWQKDAAAKIDFFTLKAAVQQMLETLGAPAAQYRAAKLAPFHPGRCAALSIDGEDLGMLGQLHPEIAERYDLRHRAYLADIDLDALVRHISLIKELVPLSRFPSADRDLALVLPESVPAAAVDATIRSAGGDLLESVQVFDVYTGAPIPAGFKSLALALRLRAADRTLTEGEVDATMQVIVLAVESELQAKLRA